MADKERRAYRDAQVKKLLAERVGPKLKPAKVKKSVLVEVAKVEKPVSKKSVKKEE